MSSLLCVCARLSVFTLVLASSLVYAQTSFTPQGNEYSFSGALPGEQTYPQVAINPNGGWVVWQDNITDGDGLGISAQRLNSTLSDNLGFGALRVNQIGAGDQKNAQVALFPDGSAVFVWQGGSDTNMDIYARFINSNGVFTTGDVLVNTFTNWNQVNPRVAVLATGAAVIVWSSYGEDPGDDFTFQGVYGQKFSATGQKIGGEFHIPQSTAYNQRDPSITAMADGGFLVAWISDAPPQLTYDSQGNILNLAVDNVHLYARRFDSTTAALGNEFRVDAGNLIAATPVVSGQADGGFVVVWGQLDKTITATTTNSWDIYSRSFDSNSAPVTASARVNTWTYGDQISPVVTTVGSDHMVVWTSYGEDGSGAGVYGQFLSAAGGPVGGEFRVNTTTVSNQQQPALASDGYGTILAVWSGIVPGSGFDIFGQRYSVVRAVPTPPSAFVVSVNSSAVTIIWPPLAGYLVSGYQLYIDGSTTPVFTTTNSFVLSGLSASSSHTVQLVYVLADGRRSAQSAVATGSTWGAATHNVLPDDWQTKYFGINPDKWPSPYADSDGDGASNWDEFLAGTNPMDPNSVLRTSLVVVSGQTQFHWTTTPGLIYQAQSSPDLKNWTNIGSPRLAAGADDFVYIDNSNSAAYYRIILLR